MATKISENSYEPRQSRHVSESITPADGDVWQERLAVCEGMTNQGELKLMIRSFFRNARTHKRVWDEQPSGASNVIHAGAEMRKLAQLQKEELQLTLNMIPSEEAREPEKLIKKKKGLFGRFKRKDKSSHRDESKDLNLQRAIERSMSETQGDAEPVVYFRTEKNAGFDHTTHSPSRPTEDEELQLAMALSMSEVSESQHDSTNDFGLSEEELFQRALRASKKFSETESSNSYLSKATDRSDDERRALQHPSGVVTPSASISYQGKTDPNERYRLAVSKTTNKKPPPSCGHSTEDSRLL
jgi:hypothetical protein